MIIELYGLPATGKTELASQLKNTGDFHVVKVSQWPELLWLNLLFFIKHPSLSLVNIWFIIKNSSDIRMFRSKLANCFFQYNAKYQKALRMKNSVLDQGHRQNAISIFDREMPTDFIKWYLKLLPKVDKIIVCYLPLDQWQESIGKRGYFARGTEFDFSSDWIRSLAANDRKVREILNGYQGVISYDYQSDQGNLLLDFLKN